MASPSIAVEPEVQKFKALHEYTVIELLIFLFKLTVAGLILWLPFAGIWWFINFAASH